MLLAGLRGAARRPTNLAQVKQVVQEAAETPSAFLERLKEAYRMYTPYDPDDPGQMTNVSMSFIWQAAPDIRAKLQRIENLQGYTLQDLLKEAERIYNKRETQEEKENRVRREMIHGNVSSMGNINHCVFALKNHKSQGSYVIPFRGGL